MGYGLEAFQPVSLSPDSQVLSPGIRNVVFESYSMGQGDPRQEAWVCDCDSHEHQDPGRGQPANKDDCPVSMCQVPVTGFLHTGDLGTESAPRTPVLHVLCATVLLRLPQRCDGRWSRENISAARGTVFLL